MTDELIEWQPLGKFTERDMLDALHRRYSQLTQGVTDRWVRAEHVRADVGFDQRTADFVAQDTWSHKGCELHGHEVKISRSDWLRELTDPAKSWAIKRYCDRWWLVVPDRTIVRDDLPEDWGLIAFNSTGSLHVYRRAPKLNPEPIGPGFRASLMRAVAKTSERRAAR